jgi:thiamine-monophosphate kinase
MYSEREIIGKIRQRFRDSGAITGIGDDAAVLVPPPSGFSTLFCSDLLVENTHFRRDSHPPESLGFKSVAINVSDIGAMGGLPAYCVLSLALPPETGTAWVDAFLDGLARACREFGVALVGGDTAESERIFIDVAMIGSVHAGRAVGRGGARPGNDVYVTGSLGNAGRGLSLLGTSGDTEHPAVRRHLYPTPRHSVGYTLAGRATAMIDVSDGLSRDLAHVLEASGVSAEIDARRVPRENDVSLDLALHGGEDYELIVTGSGLPDEVDGVPLTRIGRIVASEGADRAWLVTESGREILEDRGWRHFG